MKTIGARTIRRLRNRDLPRLLRFLHRHRDASLILLSNVRRAGLEDRGQAFQGTYVARMVGREITGVAAHYWNGMLVLQAPDDAAELAAHALHASERGLNGILGPSAQVRLATAVDNAVAPVFDSSEILYSLELAELVVPPSGVGITAVRRATLADLDTLMHWSADYNVELIGSTRNPAMLEACGKAVTRLIQGGHQWVLPALEPGEGNLLAACTFNAGVDEFIQIGGVWTPRALRARGHARTVVAGALRQASHEGITRAVLFTGSENHPAQRAYRALGFAPTGTYHIMLYRHPA